ncbi:hypothetical protein LAV84_04975 [Rhizobium sp. VS19-DR104.2]|uniref:hypothetical protein n=1 Tax=unclassified Rhizobium TaxID=2613769 RepID=UPI001CC3F154|nr:MULTISPECIES: hypothetical protein [unclassified Rhizobium]MBZ5757964.1 hypothetical protein [Rhizobium sp. VS19-DR96]MBZ5765206.1 hypothetical protein [Rhizobium sp. VS19-DR129.2]MBZ5772749.1 hypothetical protein [Rhizobium sp. VS19-DRK62.2]MBZ5782564.1 hypothetical protein [Rhizobium sp. VS19-DR121]MBZ5800012.1 hypothetical protein [Rhizobium sp. VS19-DR181]
MTESTVADSSTRMGRPPLNMKKTKIAFPEEMLTRIRDLVGDKHMSKFIRDAVEGALKTADHVKSTEKKEG